MQFMMLGKYSNQGLAALFKTQMMTATTISSMMEKAGGKLIDLHLTRIDTTSWQLVKLIVLKILRQSSY